MDSKQFKECAREMVDYSANYLDTIRERQVFPDVKPGYLRELIPPEAPLDPEPWENILPDVERVIMPGVTHWHHPNFYAYFPTGNSYPAILADILSATLGVIGFSWVSCPACTELEIVMMDWLAKLMGLPDYFLATTETGGGIIQSSASESTLITLLTASKLTAAKYKIDNQKHLVAYTSKIAHSSVEKACLLAGVTYRGLEVDENFSLRGETLERAIKEDRGKGLTPCYVLATLGTTSCCSFDNLVELGDVCERENLWFHVDAAYAGSAFICPEFRHYMKGVEKLDSYNFNPHKWLHINHDCSALWVKDKTKLVDAFNVDPLYLKHENQEATDFRHWQVPLGRRFRSLKLWFTLRLYGVRTIQAKIRSFVKLAEYFAELVQSNDRFELFRPQTLGLVCFRAKGSNELNEKLCANVNETREVFLTPSCINGTYFLRLAICSEQTVETDLNNAMNLISEELTKLSE